MGRRRSRLDKVGVLAVVLLVAMGLTGIAYASWSDTANISTNVQTGSCVSEVVPGFSSGSNITIAIDPGDPHTLDVTLTDSQSNTEYWAEFSHSNVGTIPFIIQSDIAPTDVPPDISVIVTGIAKGDQIDPQGTQQGRVSVTTGSSPPPATFTIKVAIQVVQWNQYVP